MKSVAKQLWQFVQGRPMPEDVAAWVLEHVADSVFTPCEKRGLQMAAQSSWRRRAGWLSSMASKFARPVGMQKQVNKAAELFPVPPLFSSECCDDPDKVSEYLDRLSKFLSKSRTGNSFKEDRLNRAERREFALTYKGHRAYNKRFRLLCRMEKKVATLQREIQKYRMSRIAKSGLAFDIPEKAFKAHLPTAIFVAYLSARASRRSVFTNQSQSRAFDVVAEVLLKKLKRCPSTRWDLVALVHPTAETMKHLKPRQKGLLLARVWEEMRAAAGLLEPLSRDQENVNLQTMIVRRGVDSTTWNNTAGAWNNLRMSWITLVCDLGLEDLLDRGLCPGKVMRLMAADVARWHKSSGGDVHPNTRVWAALPKPWEVLEGVTLCTRQMIRDACSQFEVDPATWLEPREVKAVERTRPTPELVHGVEVSSPSLALVLRKAGVFSGKVLKPEKLTKKFQVRRKDGFAVKATNVV